MVAVQHGLLIREPCIFSAMPESHIWVFWNQIKRSVKGKPVYYFPTFLTTTPISFSQQVGCSEQICSKNAFLSVPFAAERQIGLLISWSSSRKRMGQGRDSALQRSYHCKGCCRIPKGAEPWTSYPAVTGGRWW